MLFIQSTNSTSIHSFYVISLKSFLSATCSFRVFCMLVFLSSSVTLIHHSLPFSFLLSLSFLPFSFLPCPTELIISIIPSIQVPKSHFCLALFWAQQSVHVGGLAPTENLGPRSCTWLLIAATAQSRPRDKSRWLPPGVTV